MRQCYQRGCLRRTERKAGLDRWEYLWRENDVTGKRVRRTTVIGTVQQYPTRELAQAAVNGLRMRINQDRLRQPGHDILVADLVDHYIRTDLSEGVGWHSHATRIVYRQFLTRWIRPHWGNLSIRSVRTIEVEHSLRRLQRADGTPLDNTTKAKIRNLLSVLFNHAIRYEWLGQGGNPITLVRQSAKRMRIPEVLEPT
jgi:integrase